MKTPTKYLTLLSLPLLAQSQLTPQATYQPPDPSSGYGSSLTSQTQWGNLLGNLIWFYEAQRSGKLPADNRVSWRNDSALDDGKIDNVDLTGGYYDAGDYIKATYPLAFSLFSICWGANVYGQGYDRANQTAYLDGMLRWGLDWLMKAHPEPNTLYVQVGDTAVDNNYWGGDQGIPSPRTLFKVTAQNPGADAAARAASAFASCSALYNGFSLSPSTSTPASLSNSTYAAQLLTHANQLYTFSQQKPLQTYSSAIKGVDWAYPSSTYEDDQTLAAILLAVATEASGSSSSGTSPQSYLDSATSLYSSAHLQASNQDVVMNWDSVTPALPVLLTQISNLGNSNLQPSGGTSHWQSESETYLDRVVAGSGNGQLTTNGLLWYNGDSDSASLNPAMNAAQLMFMYAPMATSSSQTSKYQNFAQGQWNYALGKNPMWVPYIVGANPNSPTNPHDAKSSGGNDIGNIDTDPVNSVRTLYGAVIGGPTKQDQYFNIRSDWPETEVALDYNAPFMSLAAYSVMNESNPPYYTALAPGAYDAVKPSGTPCDAVFPCKGQNGGGKSGLSKGAIIAIAVVVSLAGLFILGLALWWWFVVRARRVGRARY
ncbi:hypothetical protein FRC04_007688 [Tulasnella sp. 424]|nr:hypothetical protein FRC04_007688 [Tulasnella sp. 424]KAG8979119.1 hypothetical protein FRC05_009329 [Tulasnella sp. 425]